MSEEVLLIAAELLRERSEEAVSVAAEELADVSEQGQVLLVAAEESAVVEIQKVIHSAVKELVGVDLRDTKDLKQLLPKAILTRLQVMTRVEMVLGLYLPDQNCG